MPDLRNGNKKEMFVHEEERTIKAKGIASMSQTETVTKWQVQCGSMQNKICREWEEKQVRGYTSINDTAPSVLVIASHGGGHQCTEVLVAREQQLCSTV